jgi:predicted O-linked N-acetylglucosamine transferase (SPINDLY family)
MIESTLRQHLTEALRYHNAGRFREAAALYQQVLSYHPNHPETLRLLGILAHQTGQNAESIELLRRATTFQPKDPDYHANLGTVLAAIGRDDEAISSFRRALALRADDPPTLMRLGNVLQGRRQIDDAIAHYRKALSLMPDFPEAHYNLGRALHEKGAVAEAIAAYRQALTLRPEMAEAHHNLGAGLRQTGQPDEAASALRRAIALRPENRDAQAMLGAVLTDLERHDQAIAALNKALEMGVRTPQVYNNLGLSQRGKGDLPAAAAAFEKAIQLGPEMMEPYNNLGITLYAMGRLDDSIAALRKAISTRDEPYIHSNLGNSLRDAGELDEAIAAYRRATTAQDFIAYGNLLVALYFHPDYDSQRLYDEHATWARRYVQQLGPPRSEHENDRNPDRRLRIGYFSHRLGNRPIGRLFLPMLTDRDRGNFEIYCYCDDASDDHITRQLRTHVDTWRNTGALSDEAVADLVRRDKVDILVDLTMHMRGSRLLAFARKPAPVQMTYLAYAGTTGVRAIDYRLTDSLLDPPDRDDLVYFERSVRLPRTYWCIAEPPEAPAVPQFPTGPSGPITFGCLNSYFKVTPAALSTWSGILREVPNSRIVIHAGEGSHREKANGIFAAAGVDPHRVRFVGAVPLEAYFRQYRQIDICLDPFPYPGGTTTLDALWMGVPTVTLAGQTAHSRGGLSILTNVGLEDLVATSVGQYARIAVKLAADLPRLAELRATLRERMRSSPLMNGPQFARDVEAGYRQMWRAWCNGTGGLTTEAMENTEKNKGD